MELGNAFGERVLPNRVQNTGSAIATGAVPQPQMKQQIHYVTAKTATVIQVSGSGPFDMTYVNPDDDPDKPKK